MLGGLKWTFLAFCVCAALAERQPQAVLGEDPVQYAEDNRLGAVASENRVCSQIGIDLLKAGGNAADAVSPRIGCVEPY